MSYDGQRMLLYMNENNNNDVYDGHAHNNDDNTNNINANSECSILFFKKQRLKAIGKYAHKNKKYNRYSFKSNW